MRCGPFPCEPGRGLNARREVLEEGAGNVHLLSVRTRNRTLFAGL